MEDFTTDNGKLKEVFKQAIIEAMEEMTSEKPVRQKLLEEGQEMDDILESLRYNLREQRRTSGNTKKDSKSREKAGKGEAAAGSNIAWLAQKFEAFEKKVFEIQACEKALRANQAISKNLTLQKAAYDFYAELSAS